jgi:cobalt/nickel transport system ATP-binding protein
LIELLAELPQTMLIASHDLAMVEQLTPRMVVLNAGRVAADGPSVSILQDKKLLWENGLV